MSASSNVTALPVPTALDEGDLTPEQHKAWDELEALEVSVTDPEVIALGNAFRTWKANR